MHIYFSGIGGVGIGPLAQIALDAGHQASGSDMADGPMVQQLLQRDVQVAIGQDGSHLRRVHADQPIDWFVHTAALPSDHPELVAARELGVRISKRDELLAQVIQDAGLQLIAIAGTHGKTTTTGMMVWTLQQLGVPISYSVGSTLGFGPSGAYTPGSDYFVYECDEFDRNFLHFTPQLSVITSIDHDHIDTYPTADDYQSAFRQFIHESGSVVMWQSDTDYVQTRDPQVWSLQPDEELDLALPGAHNRRNATLVLKALERLQIGENLENRQIIEQFPGTSRRFEKLAENLYSDYGHHPVEIAATLQMARELSDHVVLVYQPHQNIRQHEIRDQYTDCMLLADTIYWLPTYLSREDPDLEVLTPEQLSENLTNREAVTVADMNDELWQNVQRHRDTGSLVLCMGAGSIDGWVRSRLAIA